MLLLSDGSCLKIDSTINHHFQKKGIVINYASNVSKYLLILSMLCLVLPLRKLR